MGMGKGYKETLITAANAAETYKTWCISESEIAIDEFLCVENAATGEAINVDAVIQSLPSNEKPKLNFQNKTDEYIMEQPDNLQVLLLTVREAIRQALPNATEKVSWSMPTYWQGQNLIHFAAQKNHLGIYPGADAIEHFTTRLNDYKTSKAAIQFPYKSFGAEQLNLISEIAAWCGKGNAKT
jgi:uncharacterized protein YdhG (YjbR/CyaY superfamily)